MKKESEKYQALGGLLGAMGQYMKRADREKRALRAVLKRCMVALENAGCPADRETVATAHQILKQTKL